MDNLFLYCGEDDHQRNNLVKQKVAERNLNFPEFNYIQLDETVSPSALVNACETLPMMDTWKVVVVLGFLSDNGNVFSNYLPTLPSSTLLLFSARSADKRKVLYKTIAKLGNVLNCPLPDRRALLTFCKTYAKELGFTITSDGAEELTQRYTDKHTIINELDKLLSLCQKTIDKEDVITYCSETLEYNVFNLHKLLTDGAFAQAMALFESVYQTEKSPFGVIGLLQSKLKNALFARQMLDKQFPLHKIEEQLKFNTKEAVYCANKLTASALRSALVKLAQLDFELKSGLKDMYTASEDCLLRIYGE